MALTILATGCARNEQPGGASARTPLVRPSILLVTLDTTRADAVGPSASGVETPAFNALAARGRLFSRAYATVPETLPSHASMMTGLYPAGHGIHENARTLDPAHPLLAERLQGAGYETAAFVSSFVLARRFGLGRGFDVYDDVEQTERAARETTDRAIAFLERATQKPRLLWVHYFDAHAPYAPPEPFRSRYAKNPYLGEVAEVDQHLGRLVEAFERTAKGPIAILVAGDHGEGLGDHGESQHGNLAYESTMRVPFVLVGPDVPTGVVDTPVSVRRIFHTVLGLAGLESTQGLQGAATSEVVLGEAMKPFLSYGWQPQVMAVEGTQKVISAGRNEVYDLAADPGEAKDLAGSVTPSRAIRTALTDYPIPAPGAARAPSNLGEEDRKKLASLGYVSAGAAPVLRKDAPRPIDMVRLFGVMEKASGLFVRGEYRQVIPLFEKIRAEDPRNLDAVLRLATAHSALGNDDDALRMFEKARELAPQSPDVRTYLALHLAKGSRWEEAAPMLERSEAEDPGRLPVLEALARVLEKQGRAGEAIAYWRKIHALRDPTAPELVRIGVFSMESGDTDSAIEAFKTARTKDPASFRNDLDLGVLYLAARRFEEAREALDRIPASHPDRAMVLFKRAQVSVLLKEPDSAARIEAARRGADATTRPLIERERLFAEGPRQ
jgi:tetratricopeptide (TPR) repeat protein